MPKLIQISSPKYSEYDPSYGELRLYGLCADGSLWRLYTSNRGDLWVPVRAATYSSITALKQTASGDR